MSTGSHFALVCVFIGAIATKYYEDLVNYNYRSPLEDGEDVAQDITGFSSSDQIVALMLVFNFMVLLVFACVTLYQSVTARSLPNVRLATNKQLPELALRDSCVWHLFLSHIWSSGQDQVATIKRQLQLLLPGIRVFLDIDDLHEINKLEEYVERSQCILIFLSNGYFFSTNCMRELNATIDLKKPMVLVQELVASKGGITIDQAMQDCPATKRDAVFNRHEIIVWHRASDFQLISLKHIVAHTLHASPVYHGFPRPPVLYVPGEIGRLQLVFNKPVKLYVSPSNPGAEVIASELRVRYASRETDKLFITYEAPELMYEDSTVEESVTVFQFAPSAIANRARKMSRPIQRVRKSWMQSLRQAPASFIKGRNSRSSSRVSTGANTEVTHMLLYLCHSTFAGREGANLADEVRKAMSVGLELMLVSSPTFN
eukprot:3128793-Pleurochrysis_carterae.AAC.6